MSSFSISKTIQQAQQSGWDMQIITSWGIIDKDKPAPENSMGKILEIKLTKQDKEIIIVGEKNKMSKAIEVIGLDVDLCK